MLRRFGAVEIGARLDQSRFSLRQLSIGLGKLTQSLIDGRLKRPRIDLEKQLAFPNEGALGVILS